MSQFYDRVATFSAETFQPHVGETFLVGDDAELVLLEVTLRPQFQVVGEDDETILDRIPFSLLFSGKHENPLRVDTHPISHPKLGQFPLSITPVQVPRTRTDDQKSITYESVFS